jgi:hypothetical protein
MPVRGDFAPLSILIKRLAEMAEPGAQGEVVEGCVPTVKKLLQNRHDDIEPASVPWVPRRYGADPATMERIEANTFVWAEGLCIRVGTGADDPHLRPMVPAGNRLPVRWHGALSAKVRGILKRRMQG